jgi:hypothetical protein
MTGCGAHFPQTASVRRFSGGECADMEIPHSHHAGSPNNPKGDSRMSSSNCIRPVALGLFLLIVTSPFACKSANGEGAGQTGAGGLSGPPVILPEYQGRAPKKCASVNKPPSAVLAAEMIPCTMDSLTSMGLTLFQDVKVQMGAPRPFVMATDTGLSEIDMNAMVIPLRGSFTAYGCRYISNMAPEGKSCGVSPVPEAKGWCWKTSFGDWKCRFDTIFPLGWGKGPAPKTY